MRFIHTADIHLDSPLNGLSAYQDAPIELLRTATRDAFANLVTEALSEKVDFMIIAGDLYDGNWKDFNTGIFFAKQMGRLNQAEIPVFIVWGNHDAENEMTKRLVLPRNVHCFATGKAETIKLQTHKVALHGRSYREAATMENLATSYPDPEPGWLNIGVLHTALGGNAAHANYAPCSIGELQARGYQYWALGHVHEYRVWPGESYIAYPGNLQGRHIRETGPKGALLITAEGTEIKSVERLSVEVLRWQALDVDVSGASDLNEVVLKTGGCLEKLLGQVEGDLPLAVRVTISGKSDAHGQLFGLELRLRAEILAQAASINPDRLWIEKVKVETLPCENAEQVAARSDALADLQELLKGAESDTGLLSNLQQELMEMVGKVPPEVISSIPELEAIREGQIGSLVRKTIPSLLAFVSKAE